MMMIKKVLIKSIAAVVLLGSVNMAVKAQTSATLDSEKKQLDVLAASQEPADKIILNQRLAKLAASNNENEVRLTLQYFYNLKNQKAIDSIQQVQLVKFPLGIEARAKDQAEVFNAKSAADMEALYNKWIAKFPPAKFRTGDIADDIVYDYARSAIATKYANEKNTEKAIAMANVLSVEFWKTNAYGALSEAFHNNNDLPNAEIYAKRAMDVAYLYIDGKRGSSNAANFAASGYAGLTGSYANILFEEKKYMEASVYAEKAYKSAKTLNPRNNARYAEILMALNRNQEAFDKLEEVVKSGRATTEMGDNFKKLYIKIKGSDTGFEEYSAIIRKGVLADLTKKLNKDMVNEPAAMFTLTDLKGNKVSLQALKGKVVILDFWATWCGPCKASFPAMQMAVNKYKNDPKVQFLFIHTWERTTTATDDAKAYIASTKYNFDVLMDTKDADTKQNKVVSSYKVSGIPAKFVIDPKGNILFKLTGFDGSTEAAVDEISMMIDMAKTK